MHVLVVGAYGSAGVAAADRLLGLADDDPSFDLRLTLVDDGDPGGGLCILDGCMPSKEMLSAAAHRFQARHDHRIRGTPEVDLEAVVATKEEHVESFASHRRAAVHEMAAREGVEFLHARAEFVADGRVRVGDREFDPDYVVVATGSVPSVPDLPGMDTVDPMLSSDVLDATDLPDSVVVMGFGYVGMELVPYLAEAGRTDVTVVEHDARPLDEADPAFGDALLDLYRDAFDVEVLTHTYERSVEATDDGVRLHLERSEPDDGGVPEELAVEAERLVTFTGRRPSLDGLGLERAGLSPGEGWVEDTMQAAESDRVFVVGDANGREPVLHVAKEQGHRAAENVLRHARETPLEPYENVHHHVVFSGLATYPYARVGHSEASAREAGIEFEAVTRQASDDGVFETKAHPEGLASLVVGTDGTVLGYQGLHYHADVMAKTMQVVVETGMDVRDVPDRAYHPTTPEILDGLFREAADAVDAHR
ncbi:MAG: NAD(P)/FAD-dependent oxidoreductase [Haloarculaceae archaeon]